MSRANAIQGRPIQVNLPAILLQELRAYLSRPCKQFSFWMECPMTLGHAIALIASGLLMAFSIIVAAAPSHPYGWAAVLLMAGIQLLVPVIRRLKEGGAE